MWKVILVTLATFQLSQAFDIDGWVSKFCVTDKKFESNIDISHNLYCENAKFSAKELKDMETGSFMISSEKNIVFEGGDIGTLDEHFLNKFPHSELFLFIGTKIKLGVSSKNLNHPVGLIVFQGCEISGNKISNIFQHLNNLRELSFSKNNFEHNILERNLFGDIPKLERLILDKNNFQKINDDAFEGSSNIENIVVANGFESISSIWFHGMKHLKEVNLSYNKLHKIPCESIPDGVENLAILDNQISKPRFEGCKFLKSLKHLYLGGNGIEALDVNCFHHIENLEDLALDRNHISHFTNEYVKNLKHLKWIGLTGNGITETDIRKDIKIDY